MKKSTDELLEILDKTKNIKQYLDNNDDEYISTTISEHLNTLLKERNLKKADVIKKSGINNVYAYQIFSGIKHPSRDRLLQLALAMGLTTEQTQRLLKIGGSAALYPRIKRDSVIIYSLNNNISVFDCDEILYELGEKTLQ